MARIIHRALPAFKIKENFHRRPEAAMMPARGGTWPGLAPAAFLFIGVEKSASWLRADLLCDVSASRAHHRHDAHLYHLCVLRGTLAKENLFLVIMKIVVHVILSYSCASCFALFLEGHLVASRRPACVVDIVQHDW